MHALVCEHIPAHVATVLKLVATEKINSYTTCFCQEFSALVQSYNQKLEAEENEDEEDEEDASKLLEEIVRKRTLSAQSNGDNGESILEEKKEMNGENKMNGVKMEKGEGVETFFGNVNNDKLFAKL